MAWFRNRSGRPVYAAPGGLERVYVARGYVEIDEAEALEFHAEAEARAKLTAAEKAAAAKVLREEAMATRAMRRATMAEKPTQKPRRRRK